MTRRQLSPLDREIQAPFGTEPYFRKIENKPVRWASKLVFLVAVFAALGLVIGLGMKAIAAEPVQPAPSSARVCPPDHDCIAEGKWSAKKFREGKMGKTDTFRPASFYKHPKKARKAWIKKINKAIDAKYGAGTAARRAAPSAGSLYRKWVNSTDCVGAGSYSPYSTGFDLCNLDGPKTKVSVDDIQTTGTLLLCGTGSIAGFLGTAPSGGALFSLGVGSASCFWSAWISFSDD